MDRKANKLDVYDSEIIQGGIVGSFWKEYLVPRMQNQIEECKENLTYCSIEEVPLLQTRIKVLEEWKNKPYEDLRDIKTIGGSDER